MAQYDGAVRVDTSFDSAGFNKGVDRMEKAMQSLSSKIEKLGAVIEKSFNGYVKTLQNAGAAMRPIEASADNITDKTERLGGAADKAAESYSKVAQEADKAKAALSGMGDAGNLDALSSMFEDFKRQISELESAYHGMLSSGGEVDAAQLSDFGAQLDSLYNDFNALNDVSADYWTPDVLSSLDDMSERLKALDADFRRVSEAAAQTSAPVEQMPEPIREAAQEAQSFESDFEGVSNQIKNVWAEARTAARLVRELQKNADGAVLEKDFEAASKAVETLRASASRLPEALQSVSGEDSFQRLSMSAERLNGWVEKIASDFEGLSDGVKLISPAFLTDDIKDAEAALSEYQDRVSDMGEEGARYGAWLGISDEIADAAAEVGELQAAIDALSENGGIDEAQYDELSARISNLIGDYDELQDAVSQSAQDAMPQYLKDWEQMPTLSGMVSEGFERIRNSALTAVHSIQHPAQALDRYLGAVAQSALRAAAALLKMVGLSILSGLRFLGESAAEAARNITKMTATAVSSGVKRLGGWLSNAARSMLLFGRSAKRNNGILKKSFSTILKYGLGVRSFYYLFRKIRQAISEGYQNLARYSDTLNQSISRVISSFKRFENQFAASFAPLVNLIAPAVAKLIDGLTEATYRAGQFIAVLSGQKTVIRAKEIQEDYAASLDKTKDAAKEAEKQLAGFDQLNILKENKSDETGPEDMFETVPVEDEAKDFADAFKEAWVNVDLSGIGEIVGGKIKVALDNIPWPDIKQGAENTGKRLATFINGLINVPDLGKSLGTSLVEAINAAFSFLDGFAWNFGWVGLGDAIMDAVESACDNLDWGLANHALQGLARGFADTLNTIFSRVEVWEKLGSTIGKGINAAVSAGITFLERFDFQQAARAIVAGLNAAVAEIEWDKIGRFFADYFGGALQSLYTAVTEFDWAQLGEGLAASMNEFAAVMLEKIKDFDWAKIGTSIADGLNAAISGIEWDKQGELFGKLIGGALTAAASFIRGLDYGEIVQAIQDFFSNAIQQVDFYDLLTVWGVAALIVAVKRIIATHPVLSLLVGAALALGPELGNAVSKMIGDIPWEELGQQISGFLVSALSRLNEAVASVNWKEIGVKVGIFLGSVDWASIIGEVVELLISLVAHGLELIVGVLIGLGPEKILKAIGAAVAAILAGVALMSIAGMVLAAITPVITAVFAGIVSLLASPAIIVAAVATLIAGIVTYLVKGKQDAEDAGSGIGEGILYGIGKWFFDIAGWIKEHIFQPFIDAWHNLWQEHSPSKVMEDEGVLIISGLFNGIVNAWHTITDFFSGALDSLKTTLGGAWESISGAASDAWNGISTTLSGTMGGITSTVSGAWESIKTGASGKLGEVSKTVSDKWGAMKTAASTAWNDVKTSVGQTISGVKREVVSRVSETVSNVSPQWAKMKTDAVNEWNGLKSSVVSSALSVKSQVASAFQSLQGTLSGAWSGIRSAASGAMSSVSSMVSSMASSISSRVSSIRSTVSNITSSASDALSRVADKMDDLTRKAANSVTIGGLASGGVVTNSGHIRSWYDSVRKYASGTTRAMGSLFVAGESGPEIVGHINGKTEVLNESQIASAIYSAVLAAMQEAVSTLGGFLSQQMASNTNAIIAAIGQAQAPAPIELAPENTALLERLSALSSVPYQTPAYATGTVMPYEIVAEIRRQTSELKDAIYDNGEIIIQAIVSAITNHGLSLADAIRNIQTAPQQGYDAGSVTQAVINEINRQTRMLGKSPLLS